MKNYKMTICFVSVFFIVQTLFGGNIPIYKESYLNNNPACPKSQYQYWVEKEDIRYGNYEWKITGGYFKLEGQNLTEISRSNLRTIDVVWNNVKAKDGKAPQGKITLKVYNKDQTSVVVDNGDLTQEIKSLNDILPPAPITANTAIAYGVKTMRVTGVALKYTGLKNPNGSPLAVTKFEWKVPQGWAVVDGTKTASGTFTTGYFDVSIITDYAGVGNVEYRGVNDCIGSDDYTVYSYPLAITRTGLGFTEFPLTVIAGQSNTYNFSVTPMTGVGYEWQAPQGWSINGGGNTYYGTNNSVSIKAGTCMTSEKVKVRHYYQAGVPDIWNESLTTMIMPSMNISSDLKQGFVNTFSLNVPDANVNSVSWKVNGIDAATVSNTSTAQFAINHVGKVTISAVLFLKGCGTSISIPAVEVDVKETIFTISGPSAICNYETFSINLPPGATVAWSASPSGIISHPSTGNPIVVTKTGSGIVTLTALINQSIPTGRSIWLGAPGALADISGIYNGQNFGSGGMYSLSVTGGGNLQYEWVLSGAQILEGQGTDRITMLTGTVYGDTPMYLNVSVRAGNVCGWGEYISRSGYVLGDSGPIYRISPNPVPESGTVIVEQFSATDNSSSEDWILEVYDTNQILRRTKKVKGVGITELNTFGWQKGIYFLRIKTSKKVVTQKLVVQ